MRYSASKAKIPVSVLLPLFPRLFETREDFWVYTLLAVNVPLPIFPVIVPWFHTLASTLTNSPAKSDSEIVSVAPFQSVPTRPPVFARLSI